MCAIRPTELIGKTSILASLVAVLCCLFSFFFPTSYGGERFPVFQNAIYSLAFALVLFLMLLDGVHLKNNRLFMAAVLFLYLLIASALVVGSGAGRFSLARFVPIMLTAFLFTFDFGRSRISTALAVGLLDFSLVAIIVWNLIAMAHVQPFEQFVLGFYIQLDEYTATTYSLLVGKPIFTFGVHNFAAAFYSFLFLLCIQAYFVLSKKRMLVYGGALLVFTLLLKSAASYASLALMVVLFIFAYYRYRDTRIPLLVPVLVACAVGAVLLVAFPHVVERLFFSSTNGFGTRYLADGLYSANYRVLESFPFGIGYSIVDGLWYADSGFVIYLTMGGILCFVLLLPLFWGYCKDNIPDSFVRYAFIAIVIICELSFSSFMYWKTMFCFVYFALVSTAISCSMEPFNIKTANARRCKLGAGNEV